jgi:hypothetical protein
MGDCNYFCLYVFVDGVQCVTSAFGVWPRRMLIVAQRFGKHFSCHLQDESGNCNVCRNVGQLSTFDGAQPRKLKKHIGCNYYWRKNVFAKDFSVEWRKFDEVSKWFMNLSKTPYIIK